MGSDRPASVPVSSTDRAPDLSSGCCGFESRTEPVGSRPTSHEKAERPSGTMQPKGGGRWFDRLGRIDHWRAGWRQPPESSQVVMPRATCHSALQHADSAAALARQRCVNGIADESRGLPRDEGSPRSAPTPTETTAQASLRAAACDRRAFRLLRVSRFCEWWAVSGEDYDRRGSTLAASRPVSSGSRGAKPQA